MTVDWQTISPVIVGVVTVLLMWLDWLLTTLQEREMVRHYAAHYQSYPVDTVEGNPLLQQSVKRVRVVEPRHIVVAIVLGIAVGYVSTILEGASRELFIGYVWGLFLIVGTTHLSNLAGYRASRHGLHGKLYLHQRTGLLVQMGRYAADQRLRGPARDRRRLDLRRGRRARWCHVQPAPTALAATGAAHLAG